MSWTELITLLLMDAGQLGDPMDRAEKDGDEETEGDEDGGNWIVGHHQ